MLLTNKITVFFKESVTNLFFVAMLLSTISTFFGVIREFLIIGFFGFTSINDNLQIYLSLYFALGLLGDSIKLSYLNLISTRSFQQIVIISTLLTTLVAVMLLALIYLSDPTLNIYLLSLAAINGIMSALVVLVVGHKQRFDAYLSSQLINIMLNLILLPAIILIYLFSPHYLIAYFLSAFTLVHLIQLGLLHFVKINNNTVLVSNKITWSDGFIFIRHFISILGEQFFQVSSRLLFIQLGEGAVTLFSLFMKIFITARYILVDSYIGPKLKDWQFSRDNDQFFYYLKKQSINFIMALVLVGVIVYAKTTLLPLWVSLSLIFIAYFYFAAIYRIAYFKINRFYHFKTLIILIGAIDLICSVVTYYIIDRYFHNEALYYVTIWCVLRLPIEITILVRYYAQALHYSCYPNLLSHSE